MEQEIKMKESLDELLKWAYNKGQAFYRKDYYGASEDEDQEWIHYYEADYQEEINKFLDYWNPEGSPGRDKSL